jgi:hypothetical protein
MARPRDRGGAKGGERDHLIGPVQLPRHANGQSIERGVGRDHHRPASKLARAAAGGGGGGAWPAHHPQPPPGHALTRVMRDHDPQPPAPPPRALPHPCYARS